MVGSFEDGAQGPQLLIYTPLCNLLSSVCWTKWPTPNEQKSDGMPLLRLHYKNKKFTQGNYGRLLAKSQHKELGCSASNREGTKCCQYPCEGTGGRSAPKTFRWDRSPGGQAECWIEILSQSTLRCYTQIPDQQKITSVVLSHLSFEVICHVVLRVELYPPQNSDAKVLIPSTTECDLIWRRKTHQVKLRSLG